MTRTRVLLAIAGSLAVVLLGLGTWWSVVTPVRTGSAPSAVASATTPTPTASAPTPTPSPTAWVDAPPMNRSTPTRLHSSAMGVDSSLMPLGLTRDGSLQVPPGPNPAGWYTGAPTPGELGPAVIVGHVAWNGTEGVFARLDTLTIGALVGVTRADGTEATFKVTRVTEYDKSRFPTDLVYGDLDHAGLRLITCGGLDQASKTYEKNLVVFADLVQPAAKDVTDS